MAPPKKLAAQVVAAAAEASGEAPVTVDVYDQSAVHHALDDAVRKVRAATVQHWLSGVITLFSLSFLLIQHIVLPGFRIDYKATDTLLWSHSLACIFAAVRLADGGRAG